MGWTADHVYFIIDRGVCRLFYSPKIDCDDFYTNYQEAPVMKNLINLRVEGYINKGADADLWETVEAVKSRLAPFSEEERDRLLKAVPVGMFSNSSEDL